MPKVRQKKVITDAQLTPNLTRAPHCQVYYQLRRCRALRQCGPCRWPLPAFLRQHATFANSTRKHAAGNDAAQPLRHDLSCAEFSAAEFGARRGAFPFADGDLHINRSDGCLVEDDDHRRCEARLNCSRLNCPSATTHLHLQHVKGSCVCVFRLCAQLGFAQLRHLRELRT